MKNSRLVMHLIPEDPVNPTAATIERSLKIHVVFDDDNSARSAEVLIKHVTAELECDTQSLDFDDLDSPGPGLAAARSASDTDILIVAVRDDHVLPAHMQSWLGLYLSLRDKDREGVLVVLIAKPAETANPDSSLVEYLETIAAIGGLSFIPSRRIITYNSASDHPPVAQLIAKPQAPAHLRPSPHPVSRGCLGPSINVTNNQMKGIQKP